MKTLYKIVLLFAFVISSAAFAVAQTEREQGIEYYLKADYKNAVETLQKTVAADDKDREAWLFLGAALAGQNDGKQALKAFKKADKLEEIKFVGNDTNVKITAKPRPSYTDSARGNLTQGTVKLIVEFGADGTVKRIFPFEALRDGLTEQSISVARKIKFEPATRNGKPVVSIAIVKYSFTIY